MKRRGSGLGVGTTPNPQPPLLLSRRPPPLSIFKGYMLRSMTGFGAAEGPLGGGRVAVELRTVNHRFFNPSLKLPSALSKWEGEVRESLRKRVARGHVTVTARLARETGGAWGVDEGRFADGVALLGRLARQHGLSEEALSTVLRLPGVVRGAPDEEDSAGTLEELLAVVDAAAAELQGMREREGARLGAVLADRLAVVEHAVERIAARAPERVVAQRDKLREAVRTLAEGVQVDEQRLAVEVALLADRLDVGEELDRFASHITAFREALSAGNAEPVGKRLGFLLQELLREANTTGSKANDAAIQRDVIVIKEELERIREQVENLE